MKVLIVAVNAKYIHSNLAVYSLKAYVEKYSEIFNRKKENKIELAEYTINQQTENILRDIYVKKPDIIGFSCYIWNISIIEELLENIHKVLPNVHIWMGGPEVSYVAEDFLRKHENVKGIMRGEGEEVFKNIIDAYAQSEGDIELQTGEISKDELDAALTQIKGITFKTDETLITMPDEEPVNMSDIPFVYENLENFENRIIYYESSRGCPFSCSYCLSSIDKHLRFRDIDKVKSELKFFLDNKTMQVKFVDRTFNCKKDHAMEIWKYIRDNDNGITNFHFEIAADIITDEEIDIIKTMRPGLIQLEIGVQTTNKDTINLIDRKMDFNKVAHIVKKLKEADNVHIHLDLIAGLPKEDIASFENSFNMVYSLRPEQLQLGFLKVLHGSKIELQVQQNDMKYQSRPPYEVLSTKWMGYKDILRLKRVEEVLEIYYNSGQFQNSMAEIEKYFDTPFKMYDALGVFYNGYILNGEKHSRIQRYNFLLEFYKRYVLVSNESERDFEIFKQMLTFDLYLRENAKSRPEFSTDLSMYKKEIIDIYINEEEARQLLPDYVEYNSKQLAKMTHLEVFDFDIISYINSGSYSECKSYIIFDYKNRNPLNYGAKVIEAEKKG